MNNDKDDPFFTPQADDRTIIRPNPGGKRPDIPSAVYPNSQQSVPSGAAPKLGSLNPLEKAASGLLALLTKLNSSYSQSDPMGLKNRIIKEIEQFQITAQTQGIDPQTISSARYVLCTVLDEAVLNTPWGNESGWSDHSLLSIFHKETKGGERSFHLLKSLSQNPAKNRNLLELIYVCLALGFEGEYRLIEGGKNKLASIKDWLYQILQKERGIADPVLSPHWQGVIDRRNPLMQMVPVWVFGAVAAGLLTTIFTVLLFQLNNNSDPVFKEILTITPPTIDVVEPEPVKIVPIPKPQLTLSKLLATEIENKQLKVMELTQRSTVTIQGDNLFDSGSTTVNSAVFPLLQRIAESLNQLPGQVMVTGHSDNQPIRSARYPSNWHLSKARATSVSAVLKEILSNPGRVLIEGKSDLEPVDSNTTKEGRAKNRRVEITLLK
ncbi:outer membrane protein ImpK/VasF, OmpA/MotB [Methyloglobulus morosus KoM1]|uniref:Outer membrane protein ImpK/VasF, OmpA/MotB n=1 Tax=Methyloglobulus morosus KoM1 TaxID=1116472 RepID=V5BS31_9GAMM|nr:type VI secretion system protein TssL, long form [Methyloglobulus morosus]ESS70659.1 outer membrane protein ImpK/VasF, OmpA/MotB [Methyloglobulus morosus KoM1]